MYRLTVLYRKSGSAMYYKLLACSSRYEYEYEYEDDLHPSGWAY